ncbi:MAG: toxin-antitoxin system YwqK family antitoxin [Bacteroidales bacterium]|nr:toxin-antitoxin system YwqK family antitoxin [Bacteroidales bacterium]
MLHKILTICLLFLSVALVAQENDTINRLDAKGLKTGYWEKKSPEGKFIYQGYFKEGKPIGEMRRYYETGELKAIMLYEEGNDRVKINFYYNDGEAAAEGWYYQNQKDSLWTYYSFYSATVTSTENYVRGQKHGLERKFYENGNVSEEIGWSNNMKHGVWKQYYENGVVKLSTGYSYGKVSGPYLVYGETGDIYIKGQFVDNQQEGTWYYYDIDGKVKSELVYKNGVVENEDQLIDKDLEFFNMVEENIRLGKFKEPTMEDVMPGGGRDYY